MTIATRLRKNLRTNSPNCANLDSRSSKTAKNGKKNKFYKNRSEIKNVSIPCECKKKLIERIKQGSSTELRLRKRKLLTFMLNGRP